MFEKIKKSRSAKSVWLSIEWRIWATILTFFVVWILTGEILLSVGIVGIDAMIKTIGHAVWMRLRLHSKKRERVVCPDCNKIHTFGGRKLEASGV